MIGFLWFSKRIFQKSNMLIMYLDGERFLRQNATLDEASIIVNIAFDALSLFPKKETVT